MSLIIRGGFCFAVFLLLQIGPPSANAQEDTFTSVLKRATEKATKKFQRPKRVRSKDFDFGNPPEARGLVYAEALKIVPKGPVVENEGTGYSPFPRRGTAWEKMRIFVQAKAGGKYSEYKYDSELVDYRSADINPPLPDRIPRSVQHWTEVGIFSPSGDGFPQLVNMRANGYMRLASKGTVYGHSERGFVEQTSLDNREGTRTVPEKFPVMTEVFLAYPNHQSTTVYQILENETAVLARRLEISMKGDTVMKVTGRIIPRKGKKLSDQHNIGMAHISMYWKGTREGAESGEHAHDSDTVAVTFEDGTQHSVDIMPGYSRDDKRKFRFIDLYKSGSKKVTGYSLEQRDRNAEHYVSNVDYHIRASMSVSDMNWSVPTQTQLVVLPDDGEFFDNVVLRTVIRPSSPTSKAVDFSYTETIPQLETNDDQVSDEQLSDEQLLDLVQRTTFQYFWDGAEPTSSLTRERIHMDGDDRSNAVTSGGTGFGLMAILVAIEREFITRDEGVARLSKMLRSLKRADRFHGVWPHWLHAKTGRVKPFSRKDDGGDLVETSYLAQGLICVRQYFLKGNTDERKLASDADTLWREIEWNWYRGPDRENVLYWHWSPKHQWKMNLRIEGYNECLITHVLAASSPTHGVPADVFHEGWAKQGQIKRESNIDGVPLELRHKGIKSGCAPLFWAHYSFLGLDPRGLSDRYADYWRHNQAHVQTCLDYCIENPDNHEGYSSNCWGLTSSYSLKGYHEHRPESNEGTISPTAALSSFPYNPDACMDALRHFHDELGDRLLGKYGFYDAFHLGKDWFPKRYLAIDQGPTVIMIENHRSGLLWNLFMSAPEIQAGLKKLGFKTNNK